MSPDSPEISDLIVDFDADSLARAAVPQAAVVERFQRIGNRRAARVVAGMPAQDGFLDAQAVDRLLIAHRIQTRLLGIIVLALMFGVQWSLDRKASRESDASLPARPAA